MTRIPLAVLAFLIGFTGYVAAVVTLADHVLPLHWTIQTVYFVITGVAWAWPARALLFWAARHPR